MVADGDGITKPDPRIFEVPAQAAGGTLAGAWMVGDAAETDIEGAWAAGIESVWLSRGRSYPDGYVRPTLIAESFDEAVDLIVARVPSDLAGRSMGARSAGLPHPMHPLLPGRALGRRVGCMV